MPPNPIDQLREALGAHIDINAQALQAQATANAERQKAQLASQLAPLVLGQIGTQYKLEQAKNSVALRKVAADHAAMDAEQAPPTPSPDEFAPEPQQVDAGAFGRGSATQGVGQGAANSIASMVSGGSAAKTQQTTRETYGSAPRFSTPLVQGIAEGVSALTGNPRASAVPTYRREVVTSPVPTEMNPYQAALFGLAQRKATAQIIEAGVRTVPPTSLPLYAQMVGEAMNTGTVDPAKAAALQTIPNEQLKAQQGRYADLASYRNQRLELERLKANATIANQQAQREGADLKKVSALEDIERKGRALGKQAGTEPFNLAQAVNPYLNTTAAFKDDTLDKLGNDLRSANSTSGNIFGGRTVDNILPGEMYDLATRAANFNQVLVKTPKVEGVLGKFGLGMIPAQEWMKLDAQAKGYTTKDPAVQDEASKKLKAYGLVKVNADTNKPEPVDKASDPFSAQSRRLWETGDTLVGTAMWNQAVGLTGVKGRQVPGVGLTPAQVTAAEAERRARLQDAANQAGVGQLFNMLVGTGEAQAGR